MPDLFIQVVSGNLYANAKMQYVDLSFKPGYVKTNPVFLCLIAYT